MSRIAVLARDTPHAWIVINAVVAAFGPADVLLEEREPRLELIRKRARSQGILTVVGQIGFTLLQGMLSRYREPRIAEIVADLQLQTGPNPQCTVYRIGSVNAMACRTALAMLKPDAVLVIGTRIIGRQTLAAIGVPVINYHAGWNPAYRGQAGGYWALAAGDAGHAGVTVHLVDSGVDTGAILHQATFQATSRDSFPTYFYLQAGVARELVIRSLHQVLSGRAVPTASTLPSRLHYLPTLWAYLWTGLTRGVW